MKYTVFVAVLAIISIAIASCRKGDYSSYGPKKYNCYCYWHKTPAKDTSANYEATFDSEEAATASCSNRDKYIKSVYGTSGGYCR